MDGGIDMSIKTAFILGGGGGKIGFSAGVVCRLREKGILPSVVSGISSGNLVGIMAATDQYEELREVLESITDHMVLKKRGIFNYAFRFGLHKIGIKNPHLGLYDNSPLWDLLNQLVLDKTTICDFYTGVVDIEKDQFIHFHIPAGKRIDERDLKYILASTAIPFVFPPVKVDGKILYDGGIHYNTPFRPMRKVLRDKAIPVTHVIAVSMKEPYEVDKEVRDDIGIIPIIAQGLLSRAAEDDIQQYELINELALNAGGILSVKEKRYYHYPGRVFRPIRNLGPSLRFHHKYMKADFTHGYQLAKSYNH